MSAIRFPFALQQALPLSWSGWKSFLDRALQRPLADVPFPDHFYLRSFEKKIRFCPHKPLMKCTQKGNASAVLVLLSPAGEVLTSSREDAGVARTVPLQDLCITITKRSMSIRAHRGELSFPGGHLNDAEDVNNAALRETREEIGLDVPHDWIVGHLSTIPSAKGYPVTPVVALAPRLLEPVIASPDEVDSVHYVHVSNLLLRSEETFARVMKWRSRGVRERSYFPCCFTSSSPHRPSGSVRRAAEKDVNVPQIAEDEGFLPLLPKYFPGEMVWGLTSFILCELVARLAAELQYRGRFSDNMAMPEGSAAHFEKTTPCFLSCTNVVARDPTAAE